MPMTSPYPAASAPSVADTRRPQPDAAAAARDIARLGSHVGTTADLRRKYFAGVQRTLAHLFVGNETTHEVALCLLAEEPDPAKAVLLLDRRQELISQALMLVRAALHDEIATRRCMRRRADLPPTMPADLPPVREARQ